VFLGTLFVFPLQPITAGLLLKSIVVVVISILRSSPLLVTIMNSPRDESIHHLAPAFPNSAHPFSRFLGKDQ